MTGLRRFYWGTTKVDFVGRARIWMAISAILVLASLIALGVRGLNFSIEFAGGTAWVVDAKDFTPEDAEEAVANFDLGPVTTQSVGDAVRVESREVSPDDAAQVSEALAEAAGIDVADVSKLSVGPSWGAQVSRKAIEGFVVFLVAVVIYISIRFEFKMAIVAITEMFHDLIVTVGVYAVGGFQVSPATLIGVLTMLGYSLYDAVVVFDKIRENSPQLATGKIAYAQLVNKSMNQTMARSFSTSITSVLPAASLVFVGSILLSAAVLRDLSLAVFVGIVTGSYSSIFFAAPMLAKWKEREPRYAALRDKLATKQARTKSRSKGVAEPDSGAAKNSSDADSATKEPAAVVAGSGPESSGDGTETDSTAAAKPKKQTSRKHGRATPVSRKKRR